MRPIDADALLKEYDRVHVGPPGGARKLIEDAPTVGGWVSVKDRLPEKSGEQLCWFGANKVAIGPAVAIYVDEWKAFGRLETLEKFPNITHWMPLPEPPKEG